MDDAEYPQQHYYFLDGGEPLPAINEVGILFVERFEAYEEGGNL